jgi:hypothetical protein
MTFKNYLCGLAIAMSVHVIADAKIVSGKQSLIGISTNHPIFSGFEEVEISESDFAQKKKKRKKKRRKKKKGRGSNSDFGLSANAGAMKGLGLKTNFGIGATVYFTRDDQNVFRFMTNYYLPSKTPTTVTVTASNNFTNPSSLDLEATFKLSTMQFFAGYHRYLGGGAYGDDFAFYIGAGAGLMLYPYTLDVPDYDKNLYNSNTGKERGIIPGPTISGLLGFEKAVGNGSMFLEGGINLPANMVGGMEIEVNIPPSITLTLGYRFGL